MPARGVRLIPVDRIKTQLQQRLKEATAHRSIQQVADEWNVPYWVIRDTLRGSTDCPRGLYITPMARGLGISAEQLIYEAYTIPAEVLPKFDVTNSAAG